jgi:hypothetical protein
MMATINLMTPVYTGAIHGISFFNGRLLSGEDLSAEQKANRDGRKLLGMALGDGIVEGLEVSKPEARLNLPASVVVIQPGLAINREGQTLELKHPAEVSVRPLEIIDSTTFNGFVVCNDERTPFGDLQASPFTFAADKMYILAISSAEVSVGRAPVSGLGNIDVGCNPRYNAEGVLFKLLPLGMPAAAYAPLVKLRNRVAAHCLALPDATRDPFGEIASPAGLLDLLRDTSDPNFALKACDVPLAAVYLEASGAVRFIDLWSVRRRVTRRSQNERWGALIDDRRLAEGEARFLQFQAHIADLINVPGQENFDTSLTTLPSQITAAQRFELLPPVGILPIMGTGSSGGFDWRTFFGAHAPDRLDITDSSMLPRLLRDSFYHAPIQVGDHEQGKLRLYLIRENADAVRTGQSKQLALVFARRTLPNAGVARYGYGHADVSHHV